MSVKRNTEYFKGISDGAHLIASKKPGSMIAGLEQLEVYLPYTTSELIPLPQSLSALSNDDYEDFNVDGVVLARAGSAIARVCLNAMSCEPAERYLNTLAEMGRAFGSLPRRFTSIAVVDEYASLVESGQKRQACNYLNEMRCAKIDPLIGRKVLGLCDVWLERPSVHVVDTFFKMSRRLREV